VKKRKIEEFKQIHTFAMRQLFFETIQGPASWRDWNGFFEIDYICTSYMSSTNSTRHIF